MKNRGRRPKVPERDVAPVGRAIREWRRKYNLSEIDLAKLARLGAEKRGHISKIEQGVIRQPRSEFLDRIAQVFRRRTGGGRPTWQDLFIGLLPEDVLGLPMDGRVAAGQTIERGQDIQHIDLSKELAKGNYLLQATGDSMIDEHITSGDYVLVDGKDLTVSEGDLFIACELDGAYEVSRTIKRYHWDENKKQVELQPSNKDMDPIVIGREEWKNKWTSGGKVKATIRIIKPGERGKTY